MTNYQGKYHLEEKDTLSLLSQYENTFFWLKKNPKENQSDLEKITKILYKRMSDSFDVIAKLGVAATMPGFGFLEIELSRGIAGSSSVQQRRKLWSDLSSSKTHGSCWCLF